MIIIVYLLIMFHLLSCALHDLQWNSINLVVHPDRISHTGTNLNHQHTEIGATKIQGKVLSSFCESNKFQ